MPEYQKYQGTFKWQGKLITLYTHGHTKVEAFQNFCDQLADNTVGYTREHVRAYFGSNRFNHRNDYEIQKCE